MSHWQRSEHNTLEPTYLASGHLHDDAPNTPDVHWPAHVLLEDHLGRHVSWRHVKGNIVRTCRTRAEKAVERAWRWYSRMVPTCCLISLGMVMLLKFLSWTLRPKSPSFMEPLEARNMLAPAGEIGQRTPFHQQYIHTNIMQARILLECVSTQWLLFSSDMELKVYVCA